MKIALTGNTKGIGGELTRIFEGGGHEVIGFCRSNGYNIDSIDCRDQIIHESQNCDVFINNAWHPTGQIALFNSMREAWYQDRTKTIVNMNSRTVYIDNPKEYTQSKLELKKLATEALNDYHRKYRLINLYPGYVRTPFLPDHLHDDPDLNMLTVEEAGNIIAWAVNQPQHVEIGDISFWCTVTFK